MKADRSPPRCEGCLTSMTYQEIAERLGLSDTRVQQIEAVALKKLRKEAKRLGWEP